MNAMKKAWEIARIGQLKFGGKVKEYFAESLKLAWKMVNTNAVVTEIKSNDWANYGKHRLYIAGTVKVSEAKIVYYQGTPNIVTNNYSRSFKGYYDYKSQKVVYVDLPRLTACSKAIQNDVSSLVKEAINAESKEKAHFAEKQSRRNRMTKEDLEDIYDLPFELVKLA